MFSKRTQWNLAANRFTQAVCRHREAGRELLDLSVSNPTAVGLKIDASRVLEAFSNPQMLEYHPDPKGMLSARKTVANYYRERDAGKPVIDPERIVLTTSTSEGYSFLFRLLCDAGDEILVPQPSYPLFEFLADLEDVRLRRYGLFYDQGWHIDFASIQSAIGARTRAVAVVHPNNPTGSYVRQTEFDELNRVCSARGLALIADEVFWDYSHTGQTPISFAHNQGSLTFTLSGVSKISCLPQMKLAWIVSSGPRDLVKSAGTRLEVIADTYLSMNAPVQLAAPALLEHRRQVQPLLAFRIAENLRELDAQLGRYPSITRLQIGAGWYATLRVPALGPDEELAIRLLERCSVLVHPGHFYDFTGDGYLVVSLIVPPQEFVEGVRRVVAEVGRMAN